MSATAPRRSTCAAYAHAVGAAAQQLPPLFGTSLSWEKAVSWSMMLVTPRLGIQSLYWPFTLELDLMILVGPLQLGIFCECV